MGVGDLGIDGRLIQWPDGSLATPVVTAEPAPPPAAAPAQVEAEVDVNRDGYLDRVTYDPEKLGGAVFDPSVDAAAILAVELGGVPVRAGESGLDRFYGRPLIATPVTLESVEALAARYPELLNDIQLPLSDHYGYAELVQGPNGVDFFLRVYPLDEVEAGVPVGRGWESDWVGNGLAFTGGRVDDGSGSVTALSAPGPLAGELGERTELATTVDISMWSQTLSMGDIEALKAMDVSHVIVGTQVPEIAAQQLAMLAEHGFTTDLYIYLNWNEPAADQVEEAMDLAAGFPVGTVWLDIEEEEQALALGLTAEDLIARTQEAVSTFETLSEASGLPTELGIYTSRGFWNSYMARTEQFADLPLWYAHWPSNDEAVAAAAGITSENFLEEWTNPPESESFQFGGFTAVGRQWGGNFHTSTGMVYDPSFLYLPDNQAQLTADRMASPVLGLPTPGTHLPGDAGTAAPQAANPDVTAPQAAGTATGGVPSAGATGTPAVVASPTVTPLMGFHPGLVANGGFIDGWTTLGNVNGVNGNQVPNGWQFEFTQGAVHTTHLLAPMVPENERLGAPSAVFFEDQKMDPEKPEYGKGADWGWQESTFKVFNSGDTDPFSVTMTQTLTGLTPGVPVTVEIPVNIGTHPGNYVPDFVGSASFQATVGDQTSVVERQGPRQGFEVLSFTVIPGPDGTVPIRLTMAGAGRADFFLDGVRATQGA